MWEINENEVGMRRLGGIQHVGMNRMTVRVAAVQGLRIQSAGKRSDLVFRGCYKQQTNNLGAREITSTLSTQDLNL
jgi:hypothetical protein